MTDKEIKLKKLKALLEITNEGLSKKEFDNAFKSILKIVLEIEKKQVIKINQAIDKVKSEQEALKNATGLDLNDLTAKFGKSIDKALKEQENGLNFLRDKARIIKDFTNGKNGKDADETKIIKEVLNQIKLPEQKEIILDNPEQIRDKLEKLTGKEKLEISAINGLEKIIDELKQRKLSGKGGGGFSAIAFNMHHIDNELLGTGDGSTTAFTLNHAPSPIASLKIIVGAGELFETDDWTISGQAITFLTAPPSGAKVRANYRI